MKHPQDWKTFKLKNKWAPTRLIAKIYPEFKKYDLDNWLKTNQRARTILNLKYWRPTLEMDTERARVVLTEIFKYYIEHEAQIEIKDDNACKNLIRHSLDRKNELHSYFSSKYLAQTKYGYEDWKKKGYTNFAFVCFHFYPGQEWCIKKGLMPEMFSQTENKFIDNETVLVMMELIWLKHIIKLPDDANESIINQTKEEFYVRCEERDFIRSKEHWHQWGVSTLLYNRKTSEFREWEKLLASKFAVDIGLEEENENNINWNTRRYIEENPERKFDRCLYTDTYPCDLHHLLPRSRYSELIYHPENVVPLCPTIHSLITRKKWSKNAESEYLQAMVDWQKAEDGQRIDTFNKVMNLLKQEAYG